MNTGIVRKIDNLGRIVLPKELRKTMCINPGDDFNIIINSEEIILRKHFQLKNIEDKIIEIINCFESVLKYKFFFIINNKIINLNHKRINSFLENKILERKVYIGDKNINRISDDLEEYGQLVLFPIVNNSDLLGSIIILSNDNINNIINVSKVIKNIIINILIKE